MRTIIAEFKVEDNGLVVNKTIDMITSNKGKIRNEFSKEDFEGGVKTNITINFLDENELYLFENYIKNYYDYDLRILTDTQELYENDSNFRELCKKVKEAKYQRDTYINKQKLKK